MFSFLSKDGTMGLRLSEKDREEFMKSFNCQLMEQHGRMMKEYVEVPDALLSNAKQASSYLQKSLNYVSTLKTKTNKKERMIELVALIPRSKAKTPTN